MKEFIDINSLDRQEQSRDLSRMALAKHLLEKLVCPQSLATLIYFPASDSEEEFLFCPKSQLRYRIDEGIPLMLVSDAERLDDAACAALEARASELGS